MRDTVSVIGQNVRMRREQLNLSQEELARLAGTKQQNIQQLEAGVVEHPRYLNKLLEVLGCDYEELAKGDFYAVRRNGHYLSVQEEVAHYGKLSLRIERDAHTRRWKITSSNIGELEAIQPTENLDSLLMLAALAIRGETP